MELLLIRHALPVRIEDADGPADPELSDEGWWQADALADWLAHEHLDAIWSSPMRRALQTCEPLAKSTGHEIKIDDDLAEFDRNAVSYIPIEELKANNDPRWTEMATGNWVNDDGITPSEFRSIVVPGVERVIESSPSQRVALICHGGVINAYLSHILGMSEVMFFEPKYTSITRIMASRNGHRSMISANEVAHLRHRS